MSEEYINRTEFNSLKDEVNEIKKEMGESAKLLQAIDKKIDIINEKIITSDKIDELKYSPLEKRVQKIEDGQSWLWKTVFGTIIGIVIKILFDVYKMI